ncbi:IS3 family transposase, partial [Undibacterium sp. CY18W]|nr:IS3 family transposase [Undibacterium hunanense]
YTAEQKEWVIQQMTPPINRAIVELAQATGITTPTLRIWQKEARAEGRIVPGDSKSSDQWSSADKFRIVLETASLSETELSAYCRRKGIYPEQVREWSLVCEQANEPLVQSHPSASQTRRINELERKLIKRENQLAESEALLVLRKKAAAIWG